MGFAVIGCSVSEALTVGSAKQNKKQKKSED